MAKTKSLKSDPLKNPRSRASKRLTSPSIDTDKSLKSVPRASSPRSVLAPTPGAGISKRKRTRPKTRNQRLRTEKGVARAEAVVDRFETKVDKVGKKRRRRNARKAAWDEVNGTGKEERKRAVLGAEPEGMEDVEADDGWEDEDGHRVVSGDDKMRPGDEVAVLADAAATKLVVADRMTSVTGTDDEEEIT